METWLKPGCVCPNSTFQRGPKLGAPFMMRSLQIPTYQGHIIATSQGKEQLRKRIRRNEMINGKLQCTVSVFHPHQLSQFHYWTLQFHVRLCWEVRPHTFCFRPLEDECMRGASSFYLSLHLYMDIYCLPAAESWGWEFV